MSKKRTIAGFNAVGDIDHENASNNDSNYDNIESNNTDSPNNNDHDSTNDNKIDNEGGNTINNTNDSNSTSNSVSIIDKIIEPEKPKPLFKGFYLEPDIVKVLEKIAERSGKRGSKGVQSKLVNEALRKFFIDEGLIKEE